MTGCGMGEEEGIGKGWAEKGRERCQGRGQGLADTSRSKS